MDMFFAKFWNFLICFIWASTDLTEASTLYQPLNSSHYAASPSLKIMRRDGPDPGDFSWIKRWAAIGDSFTAGIGSGRIYSQRPDDIACSRYGHSYPALIDRVLGSSVSSFQYLACSGDRSIQIGNQITSLKGSLDLVMLTAGGNDLCLAGIIKSCIVLAFKGQAFCQKHIDAAQANLESVLKPNLKGLLVQLNDKMAKNSVVVFNKYAQYFNTEDEACSEKQNWAWFWVRFLMGFKPVKLTIDNRKKFNTLVININQAIQDVVDDVEKNGRMKYKLRTSDWDPWVREAVDGQMCSLKSSGQYPDPNQPDLQFFKPDTTTSSLNHDEFKKRADIDDMQETEKLTDIYSSLLFQSVKPAAEALHKLDARAPLPPICPGDDGVSWTSFTGGIPDSIGRWFHPNELGHETIASFALENMVGARAAILDVQNPACTLQDEFKCWKVDGRHAYAGAGVMNKNIKAFCDDVKQPDRTVGWKWEKTFHEGSPDEHTFLLQLTNDAFEFDKDDCLSSFDKIVNGCKDGDDPENPMAWRFGGRYVQDAYTYEVNVKRDNRPWPPIKATAGKCEGWYKFLFSAYKLKGSGWSTWDKGEETIKPSIKGCLGLGITKWDFKYFDAPDRDGMEWQLNFNTPIWVRARCFKNQKVAIASGGSTDGCGGND